jgi:hypothetical protein
MSEVRSVRYVLTEARCDCHPETCCCQRYRILLDGLVVAHGTDWQALRELVIKANQP